MHIEVSEPRSGIMRRRMMAISLLTGAVMLVGKLIAYFVTDSTAILADAAESVVHVFATGFAAFSLWYSERPADVSHPYGHGRITYLSIGFEGALVASAGLFALWQGSWTLLYGAELRQVALGLGITSGLGVINLIVAVSLIAVGRRHGSLILVANGKHVLADVLTTAAAVIGIGLVLLTGRKWLDPLAAIVIGCLILRSGYSLVREAVAGLMDEVDPEIAKRLVAVLDGAVQREDITGYHQLRCRVLNREMWVDVHLILPSKMTVIDAHHRATELENKIRREFAQERVRVTSHLEPVEHDTAHPHGHEGLNDPLTDYSA